MTKPFIPTPYNYGICDELDDGDAPSAANINALGEAAFDTAKWAADRVGPLYLADTAFFTETSDHDYGSSSIATYGDYDSGISTGLTTEVGDTIEVLVHLRKVQSGASGSGGAWTLAYQIGAGAKTNIDGSEAKEATPLDGPLTLLGMVTVGSAGDLQVFTRNRLLATNGGSVGTNGPRTVIVRLWRPST
jgi:hypothetical protein